MRLDEAVLCGLFGIGGRAGEEIGGAEGDLGMAAHKVLVGGGVAALGTRDELTVG